MYLISLAAASLFFEYAESTSCHPPRVAAWLAFPIDVDLLVRAIACNDQKAEPVDMVLEISIGLCAGLRNSI
jgi:hypothetical protein